jgi:hypothetical protein
MDRLDGDGVVDNLRAVLHVEVVLYVFRWLVQRWARSQSTYLEDGVMDHSRREVHAEPVHAATVANACSVLPATGMHQARNSQEGW